MKKLQIAVLISGSGTNLQALINACKKENYPAQIMLVISNKPDAYGLVRAKEAGIENMVINHKDFSSREEFDKYMSKQIVKSGAEFVCMAGFMRLLSPWFVDQWYNKLINIHPSLLPSFKGMNAQKQAFDAGVKIAGCTVHFVRKEMDEGPIIAQSAIPIEPSYELKDLSEKLLDVEHQTYVKALELVASGQVEIIGQVTKISN